MCDKDSVNVTWWFDVTVHKREHPRYNQLSLVLLAETLFILCVDDDIGNSVVLINQPWPL